MYSYSMRKQRLTAILVTASIIFLQSAIQCGCSYAAPQSPVKEVEKSSHCHASPAQEDTNQPCCSGCRMDRFSLEADTFELPRASLVRLKYFFAGQTLFDILKPRVSKLDTDEFNPVSLNPHARSVSAEIPLYLSLRSLLI